MRIGKVSLDSVRAQWPFGDHVDTNVHHLSPLGRRHDQQYPLTSREAISRRGFDHKGTNRSIFGNKFRFGGSFCPLMGAFHGLPNRMPVASRNPSFETNPYRFLRFPMKFTAWEASRLAIGVPWRKTLSS